MIFITRHQNLIIILVSIVMAFVYSSFYYKNHEIYNSPDETAQAFFIERLSSGKSLRVPLDGSFEGSQFLSPRSMRITGGSLVPASFLGLIAIYSGFAVLSGDTLLYLLMGIVSVL